VSIPRLALAYLAARPLATALHVLLLALGVATMVLLLLFTTQAEERFTRDAKPVDLVVGAKGSPLQLILSAVLHADVPTGNIPYDEARKIGAHPMVAQAIPVALGDSFRGYRIVGTEPAYLALYEARFASGQVFASEMQAVLGAEVARRTGLVVGSQLVGSHGLSASGSAHASHPFTVVGVLAPTGTVVDRLVLTPLESVWEMHGGHAAAGAPHEITALLVRYRTPIAAATLPRQVNATTVMQAASPAFETARLMSLVGVGADALRIFAFVMMASAAASMLAALMAALHERRYDLALMRTLGASPSTLFALLACEGVTLVVGGVILGLALGHGAAEALGRWIARSNSWSITGFAWVPQELWLAVAVLAAGAVTCLIPAIQAYRRDPAILLKR
jgi:putative ABC transport system permease protein